MIAAQNLMVGGWLRNPDEKGDVFDEIFGHMGKTPNKQWSWGLL